MVQICTSRQFCSPYRLKSLRCRKTPSNEKRHRGLLLARRCRRRAACNHRPGNVGRQPIRTRVMLLPPDSDSGHAHEAPTPSQPPLQRIIVDFTDLIGHLARGGSISGIPRVVFEFANAASELAPAHGIELAFGFFDELSGKYLRVADPTRGITSGRTIDWLLADPLFQRGMMRPIDISRIEQKYAGRPSKQRVHLAYARSRIALRRLARGASELLGKERRFTELAFQAGDTLLILGSNWGAMPFVDYLEPYQKSGLVSTTVLIHDLIPLHYHEKDDSISAEIFEPWLDRVGKMGCHFITVSEATRQDLQTYFSQKTISVSPIKVAPLPHEFTQPLPGKISPEVQSVLGSRYALFVGPVSGRKNAPRLLRAWELVLERLGPEQTPTLVITSRKGAEKVYETHIRPVESHARLLNRPTDYELSQLYKHAMFTVFPSLYEGWGLPVGESLWHGVPCITSNCSSLPEVGGELCDYVDPRSVASIADAIEKMASNEQYRNRRRFRIQQTKLRSWKDFSTTICDHIRQTLNDPAPCEIPLGDPGELAKPCELPARG
jgi:glycosyltransferase involved in cell wall biosynthesis